MCPFQDYRTYLSFLIVIEVNQCIRLDREVTCDLSHCRMDAKYTHIPHCYPPTSRLSFPVLMANKCFSCIVLPFPASSISALHGYIAATPAGHYVILHYPRVPLLQLILTFL